MKIPYFCCIGAELKRYEKDFDFMNQVYLYKIPADDTIAEVLTQDYFEPIADTVLQDDIVYIYDPTTQVLHVCRFNKQNGHITAEQMANNIPSLTPDKILISDATGHITVGDVSLDFVKNKLTDLENNKVNIDGTSTMTGPLKFKAGSFEGAIAGGLGDGISIYKLKADGSIDSEVASITKTNGFEPGTTNSMNMGSNSLKWKDAYIARVITAVLNNGYDIAVPVTNGPDTLALKSEVDNAANSGRMITDEGVWFAKMYAASVVPTGAEYDGTNYADFSQTDGEGNPVIKIYTGASGAWTLTDTITPPATYDGYVPVTKKIWDIVDQVGQQGGRILWNHQSKTFTPFPNMVSFEDAALTGTPTAPLPTPSSPNNQIATKEYVDNFISTGVANSDLSNLTPTGEAKFVHSTGNEDVAGQKTFTDTPIIKKATYATLDLVDTNDLTNTDGGCTINGFHNTDTNMGHIDFYRRGTLSQYETHTYAGTADLAVIKPDNSDGYISGSADVLSSLVHLTMPNYGAGIASTTGTAATNGFLYAKNQGSSGSPDAILTLTQGGNTLATLRLVWFESIMIPIPKGVSWSITDGYTPYACLYPCFGG